MSQDQPWWHSTPDEPPVDSVLEEGMKLFAVLRDWAVESGALAAVSDLTASAATSASAYLAEIQEAQDDSVTEPVTRCADCPVCRGLDALEATNPQWAATARTAVTGLNSLLSGLIPGARPQQ